jgi:hypothetical protein
MKDGRDAVESITHQLSVLESEGAIERAEAYGVDLKLLQTTLRRTPTERLEMLRARGPRGESALERAEAYGIDVSLLRLAMTWTPTRRLQKLAELVEQVHMLHRAGAKQHGVRGYLRATEEL